jgi:O-antigen ligase
MRPASIQSPLHDQQRDPRLRRISAIWALLYFNVLAAATGTLLPISHKVDQVMTQGALFVALVLVLSINPRLQVRPNWFLGLYSLLAITSLMMSVRLVSLGTTYRSFRFIVFLVVLWLLTPWWGRRDLLILRSQVRVLVVILGTVALGLLISPNKARPNGRLSDIIWPIQSTQVAHFAAEVVGLTVLLWMCHLLTGRRALLIILPATVILILTHTRTALLAMLIALLVAGLSLLLARRRVRKAFLVVLLVVLLIGVPASPFLAHWLVRGQNSQQLTELTGRTKAWTLVLSNHRPATNTIFGDGISNGSVIGLSNPANDGAAIDSSWILIYQDQGIVGEVLVGAILILLLVLALSRARGPTRALALFLIVYCLIASISESGLGGPSQYLLDLTVAASLLTVPCASGTDLVLS